MTHWQECPAGDAESRRLQTPCSPAVEKHTARCAPQGQQLHTCPPARRRCWPGSAAPPPHAGRLHGGSIRVQDLALHLALAPHWHVNQRTPPLHRQLCPCNICNHAACEPSPSHDGFAYTLWSICTPRPLQALNRSPRDSIARPSPMCSRRLLEQLSSMNMHETPGGLQRHRNLSAGRQA